MASIELPYSITYQTPDRVPVAIVARSLLAHDVLIKQSAKILETLLDDVQFSISTVSVQSVANNSPLRETLILSIFLVFQDDLEKEIPALLGKATGMSISDDYNTIVTVVSLLVVICAVDQMIQRLTNNRRVAALRRDYEVKLKSLADATGRSLEEIDHLIRSLTDSSITKKLRNAVFDFLMPSTSQGRVSIEAHGQTAISGDAMNEIPPELALLKEGEIDSLLVESAIVELHRSDLDSNTSGWRAVVRSLSDKKVRMELSPEIQPSEIYPLTQVVGDILVVQKRNPDGDLVPSTYHLLNVK